MSWIIDPAHAQINFSARHMMLITVRGRFENFSGTVEFDEENLTNSSVDVKIEAASLNTREDKRDGHLRSADFLDVENFPYLTFKSTRIELTGRDSGRVYGDLTIRGVSREVVLDVKYLGQAKSPWGTTSAGFSAQTKLNRKDWDLNWNVALETGGWLVSDEIIIDIEVELIKQPEQAAKSA